MENSTDIEKRESFSQRLKEAFDTDSVSEISKRLGITYQGAKNYVEGRVPAPDTLIQIANSTGCSIHWLLTGEGEKYVKPAAQKNVKSLGDLASAFLPATELPNVAFYELTATTLSTQSFANTAAMVDFKLLRGRKAEEVVAFCVPNDDFLTEGYRAGRHLAVVPATPDELQPGDEVVTWLDDRYLIRIYQDRQADTLCLRHLFRLAHPIYARADEFKQLYRVVG